ncbi:MAG: hypothetical protein FWE45_02060 [Firmicutes bacterium]|nr:hypothetical protein [Bacillota bacterium]
MGKLVRVAEKIEEINDEFTDVCDVMAENFPKMTTFIGTSMGVLSAGCVYETFTANSSFMFPAVLSGYAAKKLLTPMIPRTKECINDRVNENFDNEIAYACDMKLHEVPTSVRELHHDKQFEDDINAGNFEISPNMERHLDRKITSELNSAFDLKKFEVQRPVGGNEIAY